MGLDRVLLDAISGIYDAAVEPGRWPLALRQIATVVGAESSLLGIGNHQRPDEGMAVPVTLEIDPVQQQRWVESYISLDVWWQAFNERFDEGVLAAKECVSPRTLHRSAIYNDVLIHAGIEDALFAGIAREPGRDAIAAFYRSRRRAGFGAAEVARLRELLPHLQRAVRIHDLVGRLESERDAARVSTDSLPVGLIHLDERGLVIASNSHAERILAARDRLEVCKRRLRAVHEWERAALESAIAGALAKDGERAGSVLSLVGRAAGTPLLVCVSPLPHESERPPILDSVGRPTVALLVAGTTALAPWPAGEAARLLHLTTAEAELALALARGEDLDSYAARKGIGIGTVRWHVKRVLDKTGSHRQSDVVRLVLTTLGRLEFRRTGVD